MEEKVKLSLTMRDDLAAISYEYPGLAFTIIGSIISGNKLIVISIDQYHIRED